jgi:Fe2+ or Zn2+ uptake regulation protein
MEKYLQKLKENKLKITPKRKAVIELFVRTRALLKPYDVYNALKRKIKPLGLPTIYRILDELHSIGIITRFQTDDGVLSYAFRASREEHTHQFLCRKCNKVENIDYCNFGDIARLIEKRLDCTTEKHLLQIEGLCSRCK